MCPPRSTAVLLISANPDFGPMYEWALKRAGFPVRVMNELPSERQDAAVAILQVLPSDDVSACAAQLRRVTDGARLVALTTFATNYPPGMFDTVALLPLLPDALVTIVQAISHATRKAPDRRGVRTGRSVTRRPWTPAFEMALE